MPSLQDEIMKKRLHTRLNQLGDSIPPELVPQAHEMLDVAERQLGIENGNNNSDGELDPRGGENIMLTNEQVKAKREAQKVLAEAGLSGEAELLNDKAMTPRELQARLAREYPNAEITVGKKALADDEGFIAGYFGTRTKAKVIAGNIFQYGAYAVIIVGSVVTGFWLLRKVFADQVPVLPAVDVSMG
jgi:hypothetical protein